ncbi:MAG: DUF2157 domain-containing protein [Bacteroidota bacterium]
MKNQERSLVQVTLILCAILASISISAGVIAFFAHNWDSYSKIVRLLLSFIPIAAGVYVFYKAFFEHHDSKVWMESAGTFLVLMTGSSTSLIAQIYHIGDFDQIVLFWMILSLPVLYLANSSSVAIIYLAGITWWLILQNLTVFGLMGGEFHSKPTETLGYWLLIAGVIPHFWKYVKPGTETVRSFILGWFSIVIILYGANMGFVVHFTVGYALAITTAYVLGKHIFYNGKFFWNRPFQTIAIKATIILSLFLSNNYFIFYALLNNNYAELETGKRRFDNFDISPDAGITATALSYLLIAGFITLILYLVLQDWKGPKRMNPVMVVFPLVVIIGFLLALAQHDPNGFRMGWIMPELSNKYVLAKIWFNLYLLLIGGYYLYKGVQMKINSISTLGIVVLSLVMMVRYFDMEIDFWLKSFIYIGIGVALLFFNKYYTEKMMEEERKR